MLKVMRNKKGGIFIVVVCLIVLFSTQVAAKQTCSNCPNITLGATEESIIYKSNQSICKCSWTIQQNLTESDEYSIAIVQLNASLTWKDGCAATIAFPGKAHTCNENYKCRVYQTPNTKCETTYLFNIFNEKGLHCNEHTLVKIHGASVKKIDYSSYGTDAQRSFNIRYIPINCNAPPITTTQKTTSSIDETHSAQTEETTEESYQDDILLTTETMTYDETKESTAIIVAEKNTEAADNLPNTTSELPKKISRSTLLRIVVPLSIFLAFLLIAAVLLILWSRGNQMSKKTAQSQENDQIDELDDEQETRV